LRALGLDDATFFSPDEDPAKIANTLADYFRSSSAARLSMRARLSFRWEAIYREYIKPLFIRTRPDRF
jgi:hypothetical protein